MDGLERKLVPVTDYVKRNCLWVEPSSITFITNVNNNVERFDPDSFY
jgi:hypothetical protein